MNVPRLAFLPCKERVEGSIPFGSTNIEILSYLAYMIQETIVVRDNEFVENEIWVGGRFEIRDNFKKKCVDCAVGILD